MAFPHATNFAVVVALKKNYSVASSREGMADCLATFSPEEFDAYSKGTVPERMLAADENLHCMLKTTLLKSRGSAVELREMGLRRLQEKKAAEEKPRKHQLMARPLDQQKWEMTASVIDKTAVLWQEADANSKEVATVRKGAKFPVEETEITEIGPQGRTLKQFFHMTQHKNQRVFLGSWSADLQVVSSDYEFGFSVENWIDLLAGNGPSADIVIKGTESTEQPVLALLSNWATKNGIATVTVYADQATESKKESRKDQGQRQLVCQIRLGKLIPKEEVLKKQAEDAAKEEEERLQHKEAKERLDQLTAKIEETQKKAGARLVSSVEVERLSKTWTATFTVENEWHLTHYQVRLQMAQALWNIWASIASPTDPDYARISIRDKMGNEVGGSRALGGSLIWVQED